VIQVKDGSRLLQFEGSLIGTSTSWHRNSTRWVEFKLYRTAAEGRYVLTRVGMSLLYHLPECAVVQRNNLHETPRLELDPDAVPCDLCRPDALNIPVVCPERPRHWAQVCDTPQAVIDALTKYDEANNRYLTFVAQRLLEKASEADPELSSAYRVETIL
jgi:hypothetical protein